MNIKTKCFAIKYTSCGSVTRVAELSQMLDLGKECEKDGNGSIYFVVLEIEGSEHFVQLHQDYKFWNLEI